MARNIAIYADGTWESNEAAYLTNVVKLQAALLPQDADRCLDWPFSNSKRCSKDGISHWGQYRPRLSQVTLKIMNCSDVSGVDCT